MPRLARIAERVSGGSTPPLISRANNFNSVRYQPPSMAEREALYTKLTPDSGWYESLQREVGQLNRNAIANVGMAAADRKEYLRPIYTRAIANYPVHDSTYLRQPVQAADIPIRRDAQLINEYKPGINGFYQTYPVGETLIAVNPDMAAGLQTKTAIHELAHHTLGHNINNPLSTPIREFQAEAVARGVRERLGALSPNDQTASASYIAGYLTNLAGTGITPSGLFAQNRDAIAQAVDTLAPVAAQPFSRIVPQLYSDFNPFSR